MFIHLRTLLTKAVVKSLDRDTALRDAPAGPTARLLRESSRATVGLSLTSSLASQYGMMMLVSDDVN